MPYYFWIPALILIYTTNAFVSVKINSSPSSKFWFALMLILPPIPLWTFVAKYSKNIVFDALLYDAILVLVYSGAIIIFSNALSSLKQLQMIGVLIIIAGMLLLKLAH